MEKMLGLNKLPKRIREDLKGNKKIMQKSGKTPIFRLEISRF